MRIPARALFALGAAACPRGAVAQGRTCGAIAEVRGDDAVVAEVVRQLASRGVATTASPGCPEAVASLRQDGEAIVVTVRDAHGRTSTRTVTKADEAATLIESWARPLDADLFAASDLDETTRAPVTAATPAASVDETPEVAPTTRDPFSVAVTGAVALRAGASPMVGASITGCARRSSWCFGATGHVWRAADGDASDAALLASAELTVPIGRVAVIPGVAVGAGYLATSMSADTQGQDGLSDGWTPRAEARIHATYPLAGRVLLDACLGVLTRRDANSAQSQDGMTSATFDVAVELGAGLRVGAW
ncbi:MAG: hypothetical protein JO257_33775 [Deltaproteobacteria bacterium]|nr:hypothetical protein [Deltaproteobacteria bacterium]